MRNDEEQSGKTLSRRKMLTALGAGSLVFMAGGGIPCAASPLSTAYLKLSKSDPLDPIDVNGNFDRIDAEFGGRAVTPDFYKVGTGPDDTAAVQAAFDSGQTVIFTRNYYVKSVEMKGDVQTIDFNGYFLIGISKSSDSASDKDAILKITGIYLHLLNLKIEGQFNTNYKAAIHWYSRPGFPHSGYVNIFGLFIRNILVGIQYGAWLDDPNPYDTSQSENYLYGYVTRGIQNCVISNQPNGFLKISGSTLDCHEREWSLTEGNPFQTAASNLIYCKIGQVSVEDSELLKVIYLEGCGLKGKNIIIANCVMEMPCTWVVAEGDVTIDGVHGGFMGGNSGLPMFEIAANAEGSLRLEHIRMSRSAGVGGYLTNYMISGLTQAPHYHVSVGGCDLGEWNPQKIAIPKERSRVFVADTHFAYTQDSNVKRYTIHDKRDYTNLISSVDTTGENMTTAHNTNDKSGWAWTNLYGSGTVYFSKAVSSLPQGYSSAIEVCATGEAYILSKPFAVTASAEAVFQAKAKISNGYGQTGIRIVWYKANGTASSTAETRLFGTDDMASDWLDFMVSVNIPSDAAYGRIKITAEAGSTYVTGMELYTRIDSHFRNSFINELNRSLDVEGEGIVLKAPNGYRYKVTVNNSGDLVASPY
ncbi:hypothetical protein [Paenibacillus eucommiae]|uniref:Pectate lyase superfamily protein domain-containing protein n=1 Tax=Paenibacillus eucommiae TaxID=1355755 RepID=A0ABS4IN38_9BACL|nr:hypothetical protein [Paenibacillus eucommiae]MBP1988456.1 hypothetical protein [Paenibacillus eucommiae]